jgi:hypothetical protein
MQAPTNPKSLIWTMVHVAHTGAFGHVRSITSSGRPVVKFVGCNTLRIAEWDDLEMGQKRSDP